LEGSKKIVAPQDLPWKPALCIFLDCTGPERAGKDWFLPLISGVPVINLDHHISNSYYGTLNLVDGDASAAAEVICRLLSVMEVPFSKPVAMALYTAIVMDTGGFQYENTSPETLRLAASLLEQGVHLGTLREKLYESRSIINIRAIKLALDHLQLTPDGDIAWTELDYPALAKIQAGGEHCEGIVNYPISIAGVKIGILFREMENGMIKVGLRCRSRYNVNAIAAEFGGGGHRLAAGCQMEGPLSMAVPRLLQAASRSLEEK
jgi:phosphoesterase RecJ-like protein